MLSHHPGQISRSSPTMIPVHIHHIPDRLIVPPPLEVEEEGPLFPFSRFVGVGVVFGMSDSTTVVVTTSLVLVLPVTVVAGG